MTQEVEFTILMPCLNEAQTLKTCIVKAYEGLAAAQVSGEVLIADNGSTDHSPEIAEREGARVVYVSKRGYGAALLAGIQSAKGEYVIMGDSDDSYDWSKIQSFVEYLHAGYDVVMGTRLKGTILPNAMPPLHRWLGNPVLTFIGNVLFGTRISDYHCGMRGFKRASVLQINLHTPGMEFATEFVAKAALHRLKMTEVPITYYPDGRSRRPHLRTWQDGWRHLSFMLLLSPTWIFLYPAAAMMIVGLIVSLLLLPGPLYIGSIALDIHTLLVSTMSIVVGTQVMTLGVVGHVFSVNSKILLPTYVSRLASQGSFLSTGLAIGTALIFIGIFPTLHAVNLWASVDFGALDARQALR